MLMSAASSMPGIGVQIATERISCPIGGDYSAGRNVCSRKKNIFTFAATRFPFEVISHPVAKSATRVVQPTSSQKLFCDGTVYFRARFFFVGGFLGWVI